MGVRPTGVLGLGRRRFEPWQLLVMAAAPGLGSGPAAEGGQTSKAGRQERPEASERENEK